MLNSELNPVGLASEASEPHVGRVFPVSLDDVRRAHRVVMEHLPPTPLVSHPLLSERLGCEVFVKLENTHNIGSFKIRGGLNLLSNMCEAEKARGLDAIFPNTR